MSEVFKIVIYGILAGAATIVGIYLVLFKEPWARKNSIYLISFSAGVLISVALLNLMPEAQILSKNALVWFLASFILFYILEHVIILHSCREGQHCEVHPIDQIALLGMGFHSLLDGIIIGVGFEVSSALGVIATLSVILHKLPDGISMISILLHSEYERKKAVNYSWIVALATPIGAIGSFLLAKNLSENLLGILIAIAAGSFLYISAADLIPEIHKKSKILNIILVVLGVLFPFVVKLLF
ncbi:MAG: Zinc transporter ZupT [Candidatus Berkelbacteria bacterium]|nr:Zinc transporter ZupT [Candidatus Berkelbacteria bacterium]